MGRSGGAEGGRGGAPCGTCKRCNLPSQPSAQGRVWTPSLTCPVVFPPLHVVFVCVWFHRTVFVSRAARSRRRSGHSPLLLLVPQDDGDVEDDMTIREVRRSHTSEPQGNDLFARPLACSLTSIQTPLNTVLNTKHNFLLIRHIDIVVILVQFDKVTEKGLQ